MMAKKMEKPKPEKLTGAQKDALQKIRDEKKAAVTPMVEDGAVSDPAVLDPEEFDKFEAEYRTYGAETERIEAILKEHLNEFFSHNGKYSWEVGFFLEKDPRANGAKGYKILQTQMLGPLWSKQLAYEANLDEYQGAVTWNGRGAYERHIVCVKTTQLHDRQQAAKGKRLEEQMKAVQGQSVAGEKSEMIIEETHTKKPLIPLEGKPPEEGSAVETTD
jgi:hypothetical protein